jgi:MATE family multidrug resistance protein
MEEINSDTPPKAVPAEAPATEATGWWARPCGGREVVAIALPLVVQTCFWSIMWFIDRLYLTWYSPEATAAALPGGMFHWLSICLPVGIASYANTFVAQYYGAGRHQRIGTAVKQAVWFGWLTVPLFLLLIPLAPWLFRGTGYNAEVERLEVMYFQVLALGAGAVVISGAQSSFYTGRGPRVSTVSSLAGTRYLTRIYLHLRAFGFGFGIAGAAAAIDWATALKTVADAPGGSMVGLDDNHFD